MLFVPHLLALTLVAPALLAADIVVSDVESGSDQWTYYGGWEFKGASGSLRRDSVQGAPTGRFAMALHGDFSEGGSYVAAKRILDPPVPLQALALAVRAPAQRHLMLRLRDARGRWFQYRLGLSGGDGWQQAILTDLARKQGTWGGDESDPTWQGPAQEVWVMLSRDALVGTKVGSLWIDAVVARTP